MSTTISHLCYATFLMSTAMSSYAEDFTASIMHTDHNGALSVVPLLYTLHTGSYGYEVVALRIGVRGKSNIRQSGEITLGSGELKPVTRLNLNYGPDDRYWINFRVYSDDGIVAESELHYPPK